MRNYKICKRKTVCNDIRPVQINVCFKDWDTNKNY